jgi:acyl-CoA reductase-like NAD-dependent aldehyde dehydrogenase
MRAAADNLTPVTLELGGKSPTIIGPGFPLDTAMRRILMGKLLNAGQTCIAPDYLMVREGDESEVVSLANAAVRKLYPSLAGNPDYSSIINRRHYDRLVDLIEDARSRGARVHEINPDGRPIDAATRKIAPTLLLGVNDDMAVMQEEIFGPVLPVVPYRSLEEAVRYVNERPRPLALYYFGYDKPDVERVLRETFSGGVCINDTLMHVAQEDLPFGGVGASGTGHYHGFEGFETFSKKKGVFYQSRINGGELLYPPFGRLADAMLRLMIGR